ncbi:MAG: alpha/beta hydrolase [Burkholderiaceae bacterium]|nr:alpha/beta hydrolase [Burkholderiaceae bacterium]
MKKRLVSLLLIALMIPVTATANSAEPLWPEGVPNAKPQLGPEQVQDGRIANVSMPTLTMVAPPPGKANGTSAIICPGGGYVRLSAEREGLRYAEWLASLGVTSFVLKYRLAEFGHPAPLQDVLRAVRLLRSKAPALGIDPRRIGVIGSSAGGHLAASAGTLFDHPDGRSGGGGVDAKLDAISARPDFMILLYPVITMQGPAVHAGSRKALLGEHPTPELVQRMSLETQVTSNTPPTLLFHTQGDAAVPVENSIGFYQALTRAKVPAELHVFEQGGHGVGMTAGLGTTSAWPKRAEEWLRMRGLLER